MSFENCGQKIKTLAKVLRWIAIAAGLIVFVVGLVQSFSGSSVESAAGVAMLLSGLMLVLAGWIGSLFLYGFGIIVDAYENKEVNKKEVAAPVCKPADEKPVVKPIIKEEATPVSKPAVIPGWRCSRCGTGNSKYVSNCIKCNSPKPQE